MTHPGIRLIACAAFAALAWLVARQFADRSVCDGVAWAALGGSAVLMRR